MTVVLDFVAGGLTVSFLLAALFFLRFWRRAADGLFLSFGAAFLLLAVNQTLVAVLGAEDERTGFTYVLRVLGFLLILGTIVRENVAPPRQPQA